MIWLLFRWSLFSWSSAHADLTAGGMVFTQTDGRGNTTTTVTDIVGRTLSVTDAAGNVTTTAYDTAHDLPATITDAQGGTTCYRYDVRGRKIAEWGTATQPACFGYDDADRLISLKTFRHADAVISTDPTDLAGDETTWDFDAATGLEISKTYADNSCVVKTYDSFNRLATETDARGIVKTHSYEIARGLHLSTSYSNGDTPRSYAYNHLGQLTVTTGYSADGRIATAGFMHGDSEKQFGYGYLPGSNLLQTLTMPCNMTLTQSYESQRDFLIGMAYHRSTPLVAQRTYTYCEL